ncbi:hypothetical protein A4A49_51745 [Nicotiana attenuata]|uniref:Putative plant transposon protein domain-containing protein n=1 Tax=Nicotiana attenuata TaxID=49451 RepID=A0A314L4U8_NICAT|nr:hypothetical protein A4A49_51745 [Nicotiana attenuata]
MKLDGLYDSIGGANFGIVKEFYANKVPEFQYDGEYTIKIRGKRFKFCVEIINDELGFRIESHAQFEAFMKRPAYQAIPELLCGPNSLAAWNKDRDDCHSTMTRSNLKLPTKVLLRFINKKILPSGNNSTMSHLRVCLIYAMMTQMLLNMGKIIIATMAREDG